MVFGREGWLMPHTLRLSMTRQLSPWQAFPFLADAAGLERVTPPE